MLATVSVLGKRKALGSEPKDYVLHLTSSPEPQAELSEFEYEPEASDKKSVLINGKLTSRTKKRFQCTVEGCGKAYSKPSRLEEHTRSHTGTRPFLCHTCHKSYFRETHLQAHSRVHLSASERPLVCSLPNCEKRFWTQQHLRAHVDWHKGVKIFPCTEPDCNESFAKHHQLRSHICCVHSPPGTRLYPCLHQGCTKSFDTNQHLRTHLRVHIDKRYTCVNKACLPTSEKSIVFYPTWTALQHHVRTAHPPTCTHGSCNGRVFTTQKGLRAHQKIHEQRDEEAQLHNDIVESDGEDQRPPKKRRRGGEHGRDWKCGIEGCEKDFKSSKALNVHHNVTHLGRRDFICPHESCGAAYGYKHLLQRHVARLHLKNPDISSAYSNQNTGCDSGSENTAYEFERTSVSVAPKPLIGIPSITGSAYFSRAQDLLNTNKAIRCPYPLLEDITSVLCSEENVPDGNATKQFDVAEETPAGPDCDYVFSRAYDLRRHLRAVHKVEVERERADSWVNKMKSKRVGAYNTR